MRADALAKRAALSKVDTRAFADRLARLGPELARVHDACAVSVFASIGDEVVTGPLIGALHEAGFGRPRPSWRKAAWTSPSRRPTLRS